MIGEKGRRDIFWSEKNQIKFERCLEMRKSFDLDRMRALYEEEGLSLNQIAWDFGCGYGTVRSRLLGMGVVLRSMGCSSNRKKVVLDMGEVNRLRGEGKTWLEISSILGVCEDTLRRCRKESL